VRAVQLGTRLARHTVTGVIEALLILGIVATLVFGYAMVSGHTPGGADSVLAGKGGKGGGGKPSAGGGTFTLMVVADGNANGQPNWGDGVTYDVSRVTTANPFITTNCYVDGRLVLTQWAGFYPGYMWPAARVVTLSNENWTSGAGSCTAVLEGTSTQLTYAVGA